MKMLYELDTIFGLVFGSGFIVWTACIIGMIVYLAIKTRAGTDKELVSYIDREIDNQDPNPDEPVTIWALVRAYLLWPIYVPGCVLFMATCVKNAVQKRELYREG